MTIQEAWKSKKRFKRKFDTQWILPGVHVTLGSFDAIADDWEVEEREEPVLSLKELQINVLNLRVRMEKLEAWQVEHESKVQVS